MTTMAEYVAEHRITARVTSDQGVQRDPDGWEHFAYRVQLKHESGRVLTVPWRNGMAYRGVSPVDQVPMILDALVSDASAYDEAGSFEEFAENFGYDSDSRRAEKIYRECGKISDQLKTFLGGEAEFELLAYGVDRL